MADTSDLDPEISGMGVSNIDQASDRPVLQFITPKVKFKIYIIFRYTLTFLADFQDIKFKSKNDTILIFQSLAAKSDVYMLICNVNLWAQAGACMHTYMRFQKLKNV